MPDQELKFLSSKIDVGVKAAIAAAIERHRQLGQSISVMKDGKVVTLTADEISAIQVNEMDKTSSFQS
ncbi:hypothetical protein H6G33_35525 [Calothrix sp. FACHB-1219]|uniref:hypothetical protein n=1 Tax=unclassified Calothrix TaxID=2619626 RepID=UPI001688B6EF|nr:MULTISPECIES: hypothetical protein [unclassified Calothrix]MBD2207670.1 hypothetical protein [Calothrix sp. FACHB-168]MBD2222245.1 hypothetical protein [Calothrix sp. FACHB-1219]